MIGRRVGRPKGSCYAPGAPLIGRPWKEAHGTEKARDDRRTHNIDFETTLYAQIAARARAENTSFSEQARRLIRRGMEAGEPIERRLARKLRPRFAAHAELRRGQSESRYLDGVLRR